MVEIVLCIIMDLVFVYEINGFQFLSACQRSPEDTNPAKSHWFHGCPRPRRTPRFRTVWLPSSPVHDCLMQILYSLPCCSFHSMVTRSFSRVHPQRKQCSFHNHFSWNGCVTLVSWNWWAELSRFLFSQSFISLTFDLCHCALMHSNFVYVNLLRFFLCFIVLLEWSFSGIVFPKNKEVLNLVSW